MKKDKTVIAAEMAVSAKRTEIEEAQKIVSTLESELMELLKNVRHAQEQIDKNLPFCNLVTKSWINQRVKSVEKVSILRQTNTGRLVVKRVGETSESCEHTFKYCKNLGSFVYLGKSRDFSDSRVLEDVPAYLIPKAM